ncbi:MAG TPA: alcohol dehydrogenase catalytic domain-containing protein, partial [Candidatus Polarisedimenticolaceae bacterium]|nr:alcohol dehydrogenase catalytic domain-containing protein [Candidatus Polarisedimenticolaceae bacterium]
MKAIYWDGHELTLDSSYPPPVREQNTAIVKVDLAGVCSTDLQIFKGYMKFRGVPGHEFVGSVREGPKEWLDKRVVGEINFGCGKCEFCARDLSRHCRNRTVMGILNADGAFAEAVAVRLENLHLVPDSVNDEQAVFTEPLAAGFEILQQIQISTGDEILVLGDGKLGNLCAQVLRLTGAKVTALGKHPDKLELIKRTGVRTMLLDDWRPHFFDVVVEATGSAAGLELAISAVRPRGTLVLKSTIAGAHQVSLAPVVINEINLIGSRCGVFPDALEALATGHVSV